MKLLCKLFGHKFDKKEGQLKCLRCNEDFSKVSYVTKYVQKETEIDKITREVFINSNAYKDIETAYQTGCNVGKAMIIKSLKNQKYTGTGHEIYEAFYDILIKQNDETSKKILRILDEKE
jgi:hypothetical protein